MFRNSNKEVVKLEKKIRECLKLQRNYFKMRKIDLLEKTIPNYFYLPNIKQFVTILCETFWFIFIVVFLVECLLLTAESVSQSWLKKLIRVTQDDNK